MQGTPRVASCVSSSPKHLIRKAVLLICLCSLLLCPLKISENDENGSAARRLFLAGAVALLGESKYQKPI